MKKYTDVNLARTYENSTFRKLASEIKRHPDIGIFRGEEPTSFAKVVRKLFRGPFSFLRREKDGI